MLGLTSSGRNNIMTHDKTCALCGTVRKAAFVVLLVGIAAFAMWHAAPVADGEEDMDAEAISLPEPAEDSDVSIEQSLAERRSVRSFTEETVSLQDLGQLLWAAQGITSPEGFRTAPSAGATFPLEIYVVAERVEDLDAGIYRYVPQEHTLTQVAEGHFAQSLREAALDQDSIEEAAVNLVIAAEFERTEARYGDRGERFVYMESGHAAQNAFLQCQSLDLDMVVVGAFTDAQVKQVLQLPETEEPIYIIPIGKAG